MNIYEAIEAATGAKVRRIETVAVEGDVDWVMAELDDGRWAATDDAEIAPDRVEVFATREEAIGYLWSCWQDSHEGEEETDRLRWLAERPE